jgi:hypothetical protein
MLLIPKVTCKDMHPTRVFWEKRLEVVENKR